ncbi:MAG: hypothetical protein OZ921_12015 [Sorangiineae bacterium]|nr:hypothetical protein [Polyangiaceae bacterium]MEB2323230.1 hypothetical protein [Sorangiineae bacterium]
MTTPPPRPRIAPDAARLALVPVERHECVLGAYQRAASAVRTPELSRAGYALTRRASGGPALIVGPGTLHLALALPSPGALTDCPDDRLLNRYVRPLLRALRRAGVRASYFGRDWVSADHRPIAWVGFALYDDRAAWVEAILPVSHSFLLPARFDGYPLRALDPFLGAIPATLETMRGAPLDPAELTRLIVEEYAKAYGDLAPGDFTNAELRPDAVDARPPWDVVLEEAIGFIGAAGGAAPELGGDLFASEGAARRLSALLAGVLRGELATDDETLDAACYELARSEVIDGVRDLHTIIRAIRRVAEGAGPAASDGSSRAR